MLSQRRKTDWIAFPNTSEPVLVSNFKKKAFLQHTRKKDLQSWHTPVKTYQVFNAFSLAMNKWIILFSYLLSVERNKERASEQAC